MTATAPGIPPALGAWQMYRAMVGIGLACGLLIVTVFVVTRPVIERNRAAARERAIFQVLPEARTVRAFRLGAGGALEPAGSAQGDDGVLFAAYDEGGALAGVAIEARGLGYQDVIRVLYGYVPERDAIVGIRVLESRETPGLGDRIESDPQFLRNFERLDVTLAPGGASLLHPIEAVKPGAKTEAWQVDTVTGATISSRAVATILRDSAASWVPRVRGNLDRLRGAGTAAPGRKP